MINQKGFYKSTDQRMFLLVIYIIAFFIGLYHNQTKPLIADAAKKKVLGQPIMYWGNIEERAGRRAYGKIREYIFAALVARTDIDWLALDKNDISSRSVVDALINKMEQYANFGFDFIQEKLEEDPNYFLKNQLFLMCLLHFYQGLMKNVLTKVMNLKI